MKNHNRKKCLQQGNIMGAGHVIYKVKNLRQGVEEWREKDYSAGEKKYNESLTL